MHSTLPCNAKRLKNNPHSSHVCDGPHARWKSPHSALPSPQEGFGTSIKRHNNAVREEWANERQANWVSATEVSNLYPDRRPWHCLAPPPNDCRCLPRSPESSTDC